MSSIINGHQWTNVTNVYEDLLKPRDDSDLKSHTTVCPPSVLGTNKPVQRSGVDAPGVLGKE